MTRYTNWRYNKAVRHLVRQAHRQYRSQARARRRIDKWAYRWLDTL